MLENNVFHLSAAKKIKEKNWGRKEGRNIEVDDFADDKFSIWTQPEDGHSYGNVGRNTNNQTNKSEDDDKLESRFVLM